MFVLGFVMCTVCCIVGMVIECMYIMVFVLGLYVLVFGIGDRVYV